MQFVPIVVAIVVTQCIITFTGVSSATVITGEQLGIINATERWKPFDAVGKSNFYDLLVKDGFFVDKSMFVEEYTLRLERVVIVQRPALFSKSLNLDMMTRFYDLETDRRGNILNRTDQINRLLFVGSLIRYEDGTNRTKILRPLKVSQADYIMLQQGQSPVISLSLAGMAKANAYRAFEGDFVDRIVRLYRRFEYLKRNSTDRSDGDLFESFLTGKATGSRLEKCLQFLSVRLGRFFGKKVHIFIDDYDAPVRDLLNNVTSAADVEKTISSNEVQKSIALVAQVLQYGLKFNPNLDRALLVGILPFEVTGLITDLGNGRQFNYTNEWFTGSFGFTETEMDDLLTRCNALEKLDYLRDQYGGYNFAFIDEMYNPFFVMNHLRPNNETLAEHMDSALISGLIRNQIGVENVTKLISGDFIVTNRTTATKMMNGNLTDFLFGDKFRYLLLTGYLTYHADMDGDQIRVQIPNLETNAYFKTAISRQ